MTHGVLPFLPPSVRHKGPEHCPCKRLIFLFVDTIGIYPLRIDKGENIYVNQ